MNKIKVGDPRGTRATWTLLGNVPPDLCSQCAVKHEPHEPHSQQSLRYQYAFYAEHDRWPTWSDAMAHCAPEVKAAWSQELRKLGIIS
jgi:hypothetical protein